MSEFKMFQKLIYNDVGISLADHKRTLVQSRLRKWIREFGLSSYEELYEKIASDKSGQMLMLLVNAITTNVTSFFREENQWIYMQEHLNEMFDVKNRRIRIWSAACSSGQEPYSIIIFLKEHLKNFDEWDIKILATDISEEILKKAINGVYTKKDVENMPKNILLKHFNSIKDSNGISTFVVKDEIKKYIIFRVFNLVTGDFSMFKNYFNIVFCRNVMIYFDRPTQNQLLEQFAKLLNKKSLLFIGHSESIHKKDYTYKLVAPSIYKLN
ncbi:CheR family methyltransferase [Candidatus Sulfurimonas baltica]|uniref:protein-glutamate O-methyltransferase n=1 Tax=Candidatus Sulfurimonas baltica TaxID=2740404 RepID=A0A7S7LXW1_9BACT|nr:protein-glutamate O-methyltransferase CheR [Candidatus Sulfurimonas baltica]QOY53362.1 protein-glutamate O-methyltransferase CheR [Candidatus Sulfurimonas baltica]